MIKNKKILVLGLGKEGVSALNFLSKDNEVAVYDDKTEAEIDPAFISKIPSNTARYLGARIAGRNFDIIVRSPGFQLNHPVIGEFPDAGLTSVTKIFFEECPCPIIGVTGTKGKGTTATLIYEILKSDGRDVYLGGNIGNSPLEFLDKLTSKSLVVLELSSFQLIDQTKSPHIAVVLMITSEHLNWHTDEVDYQKAKSSIVRFQDKSDYAVVNADYPNSRKLANEAGGKVFFFSVESTVNGSYLSGDKIVTKVGKKQSICSSSDVLLPGKHNLQNVLAAVTVAKILQVDNGNITSILRTFKGLEHRLELVGELSGVRFYDDSFSTTPETTVAAIEAFREPKILILGGSSKNSDFRQLAKKIHESKSIKTIILIGEEGKRIKTVIAKAGGTKAQFIEDCPNMASIVKVAVGSASKGDVVLLSPACASFGMFKNYIDRGNQFKSEVAKFKKR